ncbi:MAG: DUF2147 domain-containing protein [Mucilaginibacter sp.]|uniref:DUF2147 domain-containing protein n=1 Tax=Mucilaginibacter sp. TaxID=1882438 RepID=UPI0034E5E503
MIKEAQQILLRPVVFSCFILLLSLGMANQSSAQILTTGVAVQDRILGKWMSEEKNVMVQVYKNGDKYAAKLIWFDDSDDKSKPMNSRIDYKNPNSALRNRKLLGMEVVDNLAYNPQTNSWENGMIYDAKNGRTWSSAASITNEGVLKVTGYWHFKFIGKTMTFKRV